MGKNVLQKEFDIYFKIKDMFPKHGPFDNAYHYYRTFFDWAVNKMKDVPFYNENYYPKAAKALESFDQKYLLGQKDQLEKMNKFHLIHKDINHGNFMVDLDSLSVVALFDWDEVQM